MEIFLIALIAVAVLLLVAIPGYVLVKRRMVSEECIPSLSKIMLFVCQPCLAVYTFKSSSFSVEKLKDIGIFALLVLIINAVMLLGAALILKRKYSNVSYRIMTIASCFGNCAFFGIPVIEALLPEVAPQLIVYTTVYATVMNVLGWTAGSAIITLDRKYIKLKKIFLNPAVIGSTVALLILIFDVPIQADLYSMITLVGRMCTPISMLIMGMRLATMKVSGMFSDYRVYLTIAVKQFLMPVLAFALVFFLPIDPYMKKTFFITCACPTAAIVSSFAEIVGEGQKEAANTLLLSTALSIVTFPIMMFLLPLL